MSSRCSQSLFTVFPIEISLLYPSEHPGILQNTKSAPLNKQTTRAYFEVILGSTRTLVYHEIQPVSMREEVEQLRGGTLRSRSRPALLGPCALNAFRNT